MPSAVAKLRLFALTMTMILGSLEVCYASVAIKHLASSVTASNLCNGLLTTWNGHTVLGMIFPQESKNFGGPTVGVSMARLVLSGSQR